MRAEQVSLGRFRAQNGHPDRRGRGAAASPRVGWGTLLVAALALGVGALAEACSFPSYSFEQAGGAAGAGFGSATGNASGNAGGLAGASGTAGDGEAGAAGAGAEAGGEGASSSGGGGSSGSASGGAGVAVGKGGSEGSGGSGGAAPEPEVCADLTFVPEGCTCVDGMIGSIEASALVELHAYLFCGAVTKSWVTASLECASLGLYLVRVDSVQEDAWLEEQAAANGVEYFWIGANSRDQAGTWTWHDGEAFWVGDQGGDPVGELYSHWSSGSPGSTSTEYCAYMGVNGWEHRACTESREYICELY